MTAVISKWGNSQGLRVPKEILQNLHLSMGDKVELSIEGEKIIISPIKSPKIKYDLNALVAKIPQDYQPCEEISASIGKEEW
jgi:antitoxin MazE